MKRSKRLYVMLGILVVACIAVFAVMQTEEQKEQIKSSGEIVLALASDQVNALSWEYEETSLAFHKEETWLYDGDENFPVSEEKIQELLSVFESFGVSFVIEEVTDFGMYGLDKPLCTIRLETEEQTYEIALGDYSSMDEERYVSIGDGNVYLAKKDPLDQYDAVLSDMIDHDGNLSCDRVTQLRFEGAENYTVLYQEESTASYCAEDVYFTEQNGVTVPLDTDRVSSYLKVPSTVKLKDYVTYNATEEELEACGLNDPQLIITIDYTSEDGEGNETSGTYVLSVSRDPEELAAAEEAEEDRSGNEEESFTAYARVGDSRIIYQIDESSYTKLMAASYNDLRHRDVLTADFENVVQVDISLEGADYTFAADGEDEDGERIWKYRGEEIEIGTFKKKLYALSAKSSDDFLSETPNGKEEIRLTVYLDNENYPEITIVLYRYDGESCLAVLDGESFALVSRTDAINLIEAVNAIVLN